MELDSYVAELQRQLASGTAALADDQRAIAERIAGALDPAARLVLLEAVTAAAGEISRELAPGAVDVRLRGRDPEFVVTAGVGEPDSAPDPAPRSEPDEPGASRTTLRIPDGLKARAEALAAAEGVSLNAWLVRAVQASVDGARRKSESRGDRFTGWVR